MPTLPISAFAALILAFLALRVLITGERPLLAAFLGLCALQTLGVTLVRGHGVLVLQPGLPVLATTIPAFAWIVFRSALVRRVTRREALPHLAAPLFTLFCRIFAADTVDGVVALIFAGYGAAILVTLRRTPDLPLARLAAGSAPRRLWAILGGLLITSALCDLLVALAHARGHRDWADLFIGLYASLVLLLLGGLGCLPEATGEAEEPVETPSPSPPRSAVEPDREILAEDRAIVARLDALLATDRPYLDPGLTLVRLARRLHLPEKRLSAAVNRATGSNVSRHINGWRVRHACDLLDQGRSVTEAMLSSGFNTKSNFNREFSRVTAMTPSAWGTRSRGGAA
jgi:AraC-like DNA-binding protein